MAAARKKTDILDITIDLGGDSLKLVYGYYDENGALIMGKIAEAGYVTQIGIPAVAFYSRKKNKWLYGYEVDKSGELDFTTVVRIKNLFMLCAKKTSKDIAENRRLEAMTLRNRRYFLEEKHFPKFCLPKDRKSFDDFEDAVNNGRTFQTENTPEQVCVGFFSYVKEILEHRLGILFGKIGQEMSLRISVVYPPKVGPDYKTAFKKTIKKVFGQAVHRELGTTRALGMYAYQSGMVKSGDCALLFDIGEELISTSKIYFEGGQMRVDGAMGHKRAEPLGGIIVDEALYDYLEAGVEDRATFAEADSGSANEGCPESKKYQLLKDIKTAKNILSNERIQNLGMYPKGVDIVIPREFHIQKSLTVEELKKCLGITDEREGSVADRIYTFIKDEAADAINKDVKTVLIAGGVIETLGLDRYIKDKLQRVLPVRVLTFDSEQDTSGEDFNILANESSVYASALGMTIASALDKEILTVLSLTYGTFSEGAYEEPNRYAPKGYYSGKVRSFSIFVDRGALLEKESNAFSLRFSIKTISDSEGWVDTCLSSEEMFSSTITRKEAAARKDDYYHVEDGMVSYVRADDGQTQLAIGSPKEKSGKQSIQRTVAQKHFRLERVFYDEIYIWDSDDKTKRRRVRLKRSTNIPRDNFSLLPINSTSSLVLSIEEGILVTKNGIVTPYVKNTTGSMMVDVQYWDDKAKRWLPRTEVVDIQSLFFDFKAGRNFTAEVSDDD